MCRQYIVWCIQNIWHASNLKNGGLFNDRLKWYLYWCTNWCKCEELGLPFIFCYQLLDSISKFSLFFLQSNNVIICTKWKYKCFTYMEVTCNVSSIIPNVYLIIQKNSHKTYSSWNSKWIIKDHKDKEKENWHHVIGYSFWLTPCFLCTQPLLNFSLKKSVQLWFYIKLKYWCFSMVMELYFKRNIVIIVLKANCLPYITWFLVAGCQSACHTPLVEEREYWTKLRREVYTYIIYFMQKNNAYIFNEVLINFLSNMVQFLKKHINISCKL